MVEFQALSFLKSHLSFLIYLIGMQAGFSVLIGFMLRNLKLDRDVAFSLFFSGGLLLSSAVSLLFAWLRIKPTVSSGLLFLGVEAVLAVAIIVVWRRSVAAPDTGLTTLPRPSWQIAALPIFFLCLLGLRLVFVKDLIVPSYSDAVQHVMIVQDMLHPEIHAQAYYKLARVPHPYYHFGFHSLAAWVGGSADTNAQDAVLLLGQYFQAMAILAVFSIAYKLTKSKFGAWGVMLTGAFIWPMPAFASNWAKYPAIASLTGMGFCLGLAAIMLGHQKFGSRWNQAVLLFGSIAAILLHSRQLLIFLIAFLVYWFFSDIESTLNQSKWQKLIRGLIAVFTSGIMILTFRSLYGDQSLQFNVIVLLITLGAFYSNFGVTLSLAAFVAISVTFGVFPIKIPFLHLTFDSLIDHQFVEIIFFLPAGVLLWLGLEGAARLFFNRKLETVRWIILSLICLIGIGNVIFSHNLTPSSCCIFVNQDDMVAYQWMKQNLKPDSIAAIAAVGEPKSYQALDGGAWVEYFAKIQARKIAYDTDFSTEQESLCQSGLGVVYVDDQPESFNQRSLENAGARIIFSSNQVRIYSLECNR